jgi:hypothetical protein
MVHQLSMDKTLAITHLNQQGMSQRAIARVLGVSRGAVIRHLRAQTPNSTKAPTGSTSEAPTGSAISNSTKAPTGSTSEAPTGSAISNSTKAPTGSTSEAPTGSAISNSTKAPTGSASITLEDKVDIEALAPALGEGNENICIATIIFTGWRQLKLPFLEGRICGRSPQILP